MSKTRIKGHIPNGRSGQALAEFAVVFPLFLLLLFSIISFGLYVFYNQQLANAAREAARYAAVHSSTAQCPTVSQLDPRSDMLPSTGTYWRCDPPERGWPKMTAAARASIWGMAPSLVSVSACWSGYIDGTTLQRDQAPSTPDVALTDCTIGDKNPQTEPGKLACPAPATIPSADPNRETATADGDDTASNIAVVAGSTGTATHFPTTVTVYTCFNWRPPFAGVRLQVPWGTWSIGMPDTIDLRAVVTEVLQRQQ